MSTTITDDIVLAGLEGVPPFAFTNARIGYKTIATRDNVTASSAAPGFPATSAVNPLTYAKWKASSLPATWSIDAGALVDVDYIGIAAHTLAENRATCSIEYSVDSATWVTLAEVSPGTGAPIVILATATISARYWRLNIDGPGDAPSMGVIFIGEALAMMRPMYGGHTPLKFGLKVAKTQNVSESGETLGVTIKRQGNATSYDWQNLTAAWVREILHDFYLHATKGGYFFISWRPNLYPDEVGYGSGDLSLSNQGTRDLMSCGLNFKGHTNE